MFTQIAGDREFAAVERCVADAVDAIFRFDFQGDKVPAGTADDYLRFDDLHSLEFLFDVRPFTAH